MTRRGRRIDVGRLLTDGAVRRAGRAAVVMPAAFAVAQQLIGNPTMAVYAAIGSFALLLLVEFGGPMRERLQAQLLLVVAGAVLVAVGALASSSPWVAAAVVGVVAFAVLFCGVVSSVLAGASTSLLLALIVSVSLPGPPSSIGDRLAGWGIAGAASLLAVRFLWPQPATDALRGPTVTACRALAARLPAALDAPRHDELVAASDAALDALRRAFLATPNRPTGLTTSARARVRLVDELGWIRVVLDQSLPPRAAMTGAAHEVKVAAGTVLDEAANLLQRPGGSPDALRAARHHLDDTLDVMSREATVDLPVGRAEIGEFVTSLDPSFRAQELSFAITSVASNVELGAAAERRTWWQRFLGQQPGGLAGPFAAARERANAHLEPHSVWLHNSVRGAVALALAVLVAQTADVQHSFWVVFGTLSVLRSNALNTGQNALRGILGTVIGFVVGAVLLVLIGTDTTVLWLILPVAVLLAGIAPALISFTAGQAAFTLTLLILFNIIAPQGWRLGLVRVEDVAIGVAVSLVVGLLFWPRGAGAALRRALAEAYADCARYLDSTVAFGALRCDTSGPLPPAPATEANRAAGASRRLDDTLRTYLNERGAKPVPLAEFMTLANGVVALRLTAHAILDLWQNDARAEGDRAGARAELLAASRSVTGWYDSLAAALLGHGPMPTPTPHDPAADGRLIDAVRRDHQGRDGKATAAAVRVIWTADHLDAVRRLQQSLVTPARAATARAPRRNGPRARRRPADAGDGPAQR
jgi:uncharacterized membrane protein YccC